MKLRTKEEQKFVFEMIGDDEKVSVKGKISGDAIIPKHDDLKMKAIIALLNSIDQKNFIEHEQMSLFQKYVEEIEETIQALKEHDGFQQGIKE
ncbi:hypothetical protein HNQ94_000855 [Salirhabdus euzebyi]|uniref:Uncharacterized protein n=1 Tax=Salirhabdus euzebyi TaxID=394506 RepID=A0A841PUD1_9BACI|nr:hypothetical protein [Salirhabdus euzebyi]MBB6452410.1 hypothetical protein [Salirhabdus euzebyi]